MSELTRRGFVRNGAGAAASVTALGAFGIADADARTRATHAHPVVAWLGDPRDGSITIMSGEGQVTIHDHALAARIAAHAEKARKSAHQTARKPAKRRTRKRHTNPTK